MQRILALLFVIFSLAPAAHAESIDIGPKIGTAIPTAFAVIDANSNPKTYADLSGSAGTVLVFVRSASWCPYCIQQLRDIQKVAKPLADKGYTLVSISYDTPEILAGFAQKFNITYPMMSDVGSKMIDAFGIRDPQYKEGSRAYGVPKPGIFIVD